MQGLTGLVILTLIALFYFLPAVIANQRDTDHLGSIFLINLLFGWTILGWIAALIWAIVEKPKSVMGRKEPVQREAEVGLPHESGRLLGNEDARRR